MLEMDSCGSVSGARSMDRRSANASLGHCQSRHSLRWQRLAACFALLFLFCLVPFENTQPRKLSLPNVQHEEKQHANKAPKIPRVPHIISYPDANRTRSQDEHDENGRPFFILHVGPPKTATTTLQTELTKYGAHLVKDNYAYLGQIMRNPDNLFDHWHGTLLKILKDGKCQRAVNQARVLGAEWPVCWNQFRAILQERRDEGHNIIMSEEDFAIKFNHMVGGLGRSPIDWPALKIVLEEQGWNPIIVVGYRRLYEIMPSAKQQWDRWTPNNGGLVHWPPKGRKLLPLFPSVLKDPRLYDGYVPKYIPRTIQWSYTDHLIQMISPYFPVRILNMHDPMTIRSTFLCRVIPYAPLACHQSQMDDAVKEELHKNTEESLFYDAIATEAAEREWFNKKLFDRHALDLALRDYFEVERGGKPTDLPLLCPNVTQLEILLERSLVKEEQILTPRVAETMRDEHVAGFWKAVEKHKFCWIDVHKTLEDSHWKQFFSEIVPANEKEEDDDDDQKDAYDVEEER